jgi:putative FmdB family regulatory protein
MPLYEYQCTACGQRLEVLRRFHDAPLHACPHCGGTLTKLWSAPALQFKGAGFYLNDYGRAGSRKTEGGGEKAEGGGEKSEGGGEKADAAKADGAKDAKPAAETKPAKPTADAKSAPSADKKAS